MSLTALAIALSIAATPVMAAPLAQFQWDKRLLVLFAETDAGDYRQQVDLLNQAQDGIAERDMVVLAVQNGEVQAVFGSATELDAQSIRASLRQDEGGFEAVLIGRDGGVKRRWSQPVSVDELFAIIDAMPMRAGEMSESRK
jgi:hypothetical protein